MENTNNIISNNINGFQFNELKDYMQNCIEESINAIDSNDFDHIEWYKDCEMEDYFVEWQGIWDGDTKVGEGLDTIAHKFVLNDDTRDDFESAFEQARDDAYESTKRIYVNFDTMRAYAYGYDSADGAEAEMAMQKGAEKYNDRDCAYEVGAADYYEEEQCWSAPLIEHEKCDDDLFAIVMGMAKEDYKAEEELLDFEVEEAYKEAAYHFGEEDFTDITDCTESVEDFEENAEFGQKACIDGVTYYKVRNAVDGEPYTVYFDDNNELMFL